MRADKAKSIDLVTAALVKNPLARDEDLVRETGLGKGTIYRAKKEVGKNGELKDKRIQNLTDEDFKIVRLTQKRTLTRLEDEDEAKKINARDLTYIGDVSAKDIRFLWES